MTAHRLTPSIVANDAQLAAAIDEVIQADAVDRAHWEEIARLQAELHGHLGDEEWGVYRLK